MAAFGSPMRARPLPLKAQLSRVRMTGVYVDSSRQLRARTSNGEDLRQRPLEEWRDKLSQLVRGVDNMLFSEALSAEGALVFAKACELGLEGIVSKRVGSAYRSGNCRNWTKAKNPSFARLALHEKRRVNSGDVRFRPRQYQRRTRPTVTETGSTEPRNAYLLMC
jgi:hypothetical protein